MDPYYNALEAMAIEIVDLPSYKKKWCIFTESYDIVGSKKGIFGVKIGITFCR
jgi:hypothetical protein